MITLLVMMYSNQSVKFCECGKDDGNCRLTRAKVINKEVVKQPDKCPHHINDLKLKRLDEKFRIYKFNEPRLINIYKISLPCSFFKPLSNLEKVLSLKGEIVFNKDKYLDLEDEDNYYFVREQPPEPERGNPRVIVYQEAIIDKGMEFCKHKRDGRCGIPRKMVIPEEGADIVYDLNVNCEHHINELKLLRIENRFNAYLIRPYYCFDFEPIDGIEEKLFLIGEPVFSKDEYIIEEHEGYYLVHKFFEEQPTRKKKRFQRFRRNKK